MLYLNRRAGEAVIINNAIEVRVVEVRGKTVRLGFSFPPEVSVLREEVFLQIREGNEAAARTAAQPARPPGAAHERTAGDGAAGRRGHGQQSDWATMRHAVAVLDELGVAQRGADRLGAPHARAAVRLRQGRARRGLQGDRRRRRRGRAPARHDRLADHPAGAGRAGREQGAQRASTASTRSSRCRAACRSARWRSASRVRSTRPCSRPRSWPWPIRRWTAALAALARSGRPTPWPRRRDGARRREPRSRPARTIGILGGGQLGRMTAMAAARLGYRCHILAPEADSPAADVAAAFTCAGYEDEAALARVRGSRRRGHARVRERAGGGARAPGRAPPGPPERRRAAGDPGPAGREGFRARAGLPGDRAMPAIEIAADLERAVAATRPRRAEDHAAGL